MSQLINLGCRVADVHHRYDEVHSALFGASSFRLLADALLGRRQQTYKKSSRTLTELRGQLALLESEVADPEKVTPVPEAATLGTSDPLTVVLSVLDRLAETVQQYASDRKVTKWPTDDMQGDIKAVQAFFNADQAKNPNQY